MEGQMSLFDFIEHPVKPGDWLEENRLGEEMTFDIVNIGLHFFLKNVRPYAASCSEA